MNNVKPDWYRLARGRMDRELVFTDDMRQAVNRAVSRRGVKKKDWRRWTLTAAVLLLFVAAAIWASGRMEADDSVASETIAGVPREQVALAFTPLTNSEAHYTELKRMPKSSVNVIGSRRFEGIGTVYSYTTNPDDELPHLAVSFESKLDSTPEDEIYNFGYGLLEQFSLENSSLFGEPRVKIVGNGCRIENCAYSDWVRFENGNAVIDFHTDVPGVESDLDGDGRNEFVVTYRSKSTTVILYKKFGGEIRSAEVYDALGLKYPDSVAYDSLTHTFNTVTADDLRSYRFSSTAASEVLERVPTSLIAAQPILATDLKLDSYRYMRQPLNMDTLLFDRIRSLRMQIGGYDIYAQWYQTDENDFGLFLPNNATPVKQVDGSVIYDVMKGKGSLAFRDSLDVSLVYEDDLAVVSNYAGTAESKLRSDSRTDYFLTEYDAEHSVYVELEYKLAEQNKVRPILLAMMANVKYAPEHLK